MKVHPLKNKVADLSLHATGASEVHLARQDMPGLTTLAQERGAEKPLQGAFIAGSLHLTAQTAVLIETLIALGAKVRWSSCNVFSTQDSVAAYLAHQGIEVFGYKGESEAEYVEFLYQCLAFEGHYANLMLDDGGDLLHFLLGGARYELEKNWDWDVTNDISVHARALIETITQSDPHWFSVRKEAIRGVSEETTTGITRLERWAKHHPLPFAVIDVNNAATKSKFDNLYGSRESLVDGIRRALGVMIAGKVALVCGFGDVGKGCAAALRGLGCRVIITEIDPICGLQAAMEGYEVDTAENALPHVDLVVTATGCMNVIGHQHYPLLKDGVVLCNMGHFDCEIDCTPLNDVPQRDLAPQVREYQYNKKRIVLLAEGRLVNLGCAKGHPSFVMSCSFTNQALAQIELYANNAHYQIGINRVPKRIDEYVARLHLPKLGARLTTLTAEQSAYLGVKPEGPYKSELYRY